MSKLSIDATVIVLRGHYHQLTGSPTHFNCICEKNMEEKKGLLGVGTIHHKAIEIVTPYYFTFCVF